MKNSIYFLTCIVLSGCLLLSLSSFVKGADTESAENQKQDAFFSKIPFPKNFYTIQQFDRLTEGIYIDPKTGRQITPSSSYEEEDGVLKIKTNHNYLPVVQVFNMHLMQNSLTKQLESGEKVMFLPAGTVILTEDVSYLEMAKNLSLGIVGFAALIYVYTMFNSSQTTNNPSGNKNPQKNETIETLQEITNNSVNSNTPTNNEKPS